MIDVDVGQVWEDERTRFVISKVFDFGEDKSFSAVCLNGETINREDVVYLEELNCLCERSNEDWIGVLHSISEKDFEVAENEKEERKRAIDVLGGLLVASGFLKVSTTTLFYWIKEGKGSRRIKMKIREGFDKAGVDFKGIV